MCVFCDNMVTCIYSAVILYEFIVIINDSLQLAFPNFEILPLGAK